MTHSLDKLRRQAKHLNRAFAAGEPQALRRARMVFPDSETLRHADALHVVAREAGHESWPRLKLAVEMEAMDRVQRADRLKVALFYGQHWITNTLLADDPGLGTDNLGLQIALYDRVAVETALEIDPKAAMRQIGVRTPILHLAFSRHIHTAPERRDDMISIAAALVAHGADVNDSYPVEPGSEHRLSALYGAVGHADNMALAEWLLERGADPNDNESLYHATELGHHDGLKLLLRYEANPAGTNALPRVMDFDDLEAVRLLLKAGADPNEGIGSHPSGQPATTIPGLHQAARRMCSPEIAELLISNGADGTATYNGHTAYALARMRGNHGIARVLEEESQATALDATEALLAAVADGDVEGRIDPAQLTDESRRIMGRVLGFSGRLRHIKRLYSVGIDPNWTDEMGMPAIHIAGWEGHADAVEWLLNLDPDLTIKNGYGGDLLGTIIHGSEFCPARENRKHVACARMVLEKGAVLRRSEIEMCGVEEMVALLGDWADSHLEQVVEKGR